MGSSANTTAGRVASARATATRCCSPPDSSAGRWSSRRRNPTASTSRASHFASGRRPAIVSGSRMFSPAVSTGSRLNAWNTNPMRSRRSLVSARSSSAVSSVSPSQTVPTVHCVQPGKAVHESGLARPGRTHDRREPSNGDGQGDPVQGGHGAGIPAVPLGYLDRAGCGHRGSFDGVLRGFARPCGADIRHGSANVPDRPVGRLREVPDAFR